MAKQAKTMSIFRYYIHMSCVLHTFQGKHASENDLAKQFGVFSLKACEFDRVQYSFCWDSAWNILYDVFITIAEKFSVKDEQTRVSEFVSEVPQNLVSVSKSASDTDSDTNSCPKSFPCPFISVSKIERFNSCILQLKTFQHHYPDTAIYQI